MSPLRASRTALVATARTLLHAVAVHDLAEPSRAPRAPRRRSAIGSTPARERVAAEQHAARRLLDGRGSTGSARSRRRRGGSRSRPCRGPPPAEAMSAVCVRPSQHAVRDRRDNSCGGGTADHSSKRPSRLCVTARQAAEMTPPDVMSWFIAVTSVFTSSQQSFGYSVCIRTHARYKPEYVQSETLKPIDETHSEQARGGGSSALPSGLCNLAGGE